MHSKDVTNKVPCLGNREPSTLLPVTSMRYLVLASYIILIGMAVFLTNCQKKITSASSADNNIQIQNFKLSVSSIVLYQDNENIPALNFSWDITGSSLNCNYIIEAASYGTSFAQPIEIANTNSNSISINVKNANQALSELVPPGQTDMVELRLKVNNGVNSPVYSISQALRVTIYENFIEYNQLQFMHVPGNYQNWDIVNAPHIVSRNNNGEFEGYINFINPGPQFLLLKDKNWVPINTFTDIGGGKFGFNGKVFALSSGSGLYLLRANTNNNCWNYFKINSWGLNGSAINTVNNSDPEMIFDGSTSTWKINTSLQKGEFRIRANNSDTISFGKSYASGYMIPDYNGSSFNIDQPGNYYIVLNLRFAGDYFCSVVRRP